MKKNYKKIIIAALILAVVGISVGFSALSTTLNINGTATAKTNSWNVTFANVANEAGVTAKTKPTISGTSLTYAVDLTQPGQSYEFTVDVKNNGTLPAKLAATPTVSGTSSYITHTVTYSDGTAIKANDTLAAGAKKTIKVKVQYKSDLTASTLPTSDSAVTYALALTYVQG